MSALLGFCHRCSEYSRGTLEENKLSYCFSTERKSNIVTWTPQYLSKSWKDRRQKAESAFSPHCQSAPRGKDFFLTPGNVENNATDENQFLPESWQLEQSPWWAQTEDSPPPDTSEHATPRKRCLLLKCCKRSLALKKLPTVDQHSVGKTSGLAK